MPHGLKITLGETTYYVTTPSSVEYPVYDDATGSLVCTLGYDSNGNYIFNTTVGIPYAIVDPDYYRTYYAVCDINSHTELYQAPMGAGIDAADEPPAFVMPSGVLYPDVDNQPQAGTVDHNALLLRLYGTEDTTLESPAYTVVLPVHPETGNLGTMRIYDADGDAQAYDVALTRLADGSIAYVLTGDGVIAGYFYVPEGRDNHFFDPNGEPAGVIEEWEAGVPEAFEDEIAPTEDAPLPSEIEMPAPFSGVQGFARWLGEFAAVFIAACPNSDITDDARKIMLANEVTATGCYGEALVAAVGYTAEALALTGYDKLLNQPYNTVRTVEISGETYEIRRAGNAYEIRNEEGDLAYTATYEGASGLTVRDADGNVAWRVIGSGSGTYTATAEGGSATREILVRSAIDTGDAEYSLVNAWYSGVIYDETGAEIGSVSAPTEEPDPYDAWQSIYLADGAPLFKQGNTLVAHDGTEKYEIKRAANIFNDLDVYVAGDTAPTWHTVRTSVDNYEARSLVSTAGVTIGELTPDGLTLTDGTLTAWPAPAFESDTTQVVLLNDTYQTLFYVRNMGASVLLDRDYNLLSYCVKQADNTWEIRDTDYALTGTVSVDGAYTPAGETAPSMSIQPGADDTANIVDYNTLELLGRLFERHEIAADKLSTPDGFMRIVTGGDSTLYWKPDASHTAIIYDASGQKVYALDRSEDNVWLITDADGNEVAANAGVTTKYNCVLQPYYEFSFTVDETAYEVSAPYVSDRIDDHYPPTQLPAVPPGFERELLGISEDTQVILKNNSVYTYTDANGNIIEGEWHIVANTDGTLVALILDAEGAPLYVLTTTADGGTVYAFNSDGDLRDTYTWAAITSSGHIVRYKVYSTLNSTYVYTLSALQPEGSFTDASTDTDDASDASSATTNTASSGSYTSSSSSDTQSKIDELKDLDEAGESYFDGLLAILGKDTSSSKGEGLSADSPLSILSAETNGRNFANQIFNNTTNTRTTKWAMKDAYDMTQSVTRLSKEYSSARGDYYAAGQAANEARSSRISHIGSNFKNVVTKLSNSLGG